MPEIAFALVLLAAMVALIDWRKGLMLCVLTAILQDPLRKLTPNEPAYFVLLVGVVFAAAALGAVQGRTRLMPNAIQGWKSQVGKPFTVYVVLVALQAVHSLVRFGSPQISIIGLISYLAPVPAVVFAYQFAVRKGLPGVRGWMWFYVAAATVSLSGVYLEYVGLNWQALGEVGEGMVLYDVGGILKVYSGFFRSSEIAAWHVAAISCFLFVLLIGRKFTLPRMVLVLTLTGLLVSLGLLTGRRKMLVEIVVFVSAYMFLVAWFKRRATRPAIMAAAVGVLGYVLVVGAMSPDHAVSSTKNLKLDPREKFQHYTVRSSSVFGDVPQRFDELGLQPVMGAINEFGLLGAGLGTGSQGVQHVAASASIDRGAAEGALGKITMELGVPGLFVLAWLVRMFARYIRKVLEVTTRTSPQHARIAYGFVAFLIANAAAFSVATQVFGDLFVLLMMGWSMGFVLAMPVLAAKSVEARQRKMLRRGLQPQFVRPLAR
jgi:hypothetical protein